MRLTAGRTPQSLGARPRTPRRLGRLVVAAAPAFLAVVIGIGNPAVAQTTSSSPTSATPHCVASYVGIDYAMGPQWSLSCFATLRDSVRVATGGRVTDAPLNGADFTDQTMAKINAAGEATLAAGGSNVMLLATIFTGANFTGKSLSFSNRSTVSNPLWRVKTCRIEGATQVPLDSNYLAFLHRDFDGTTRSFRTFNGCMIQNASGREWYANDYKSTTADWGSTSRLHFLAGPTRQQLFDQCNNGTTSCTFQVKGKQESYRGYTRLARADNCSSTNTASEVFSVSQTTGGSVTITNEVQVGASVNIKGLVEFEASYKRAFGQTWEWQDTYTRTTTINLNPLHWGVIERSPKLQTVEGSFDLTFSKDFHGRRQWHLADFKGTGPVPSDGGITRTPGERYTKEEYEANCEGPWPGDSVASVAAADAS
jgi:hypothetical protein